MHKNHNNILILVSLNFIKIILLNNKVLHRYLQQSKSQNRKSKNHQKNNKRKYHLNRSF